MFLKGVLALLHNGLLGTSEIYFGVMLCTLGSCDHIHPVSAVTVTYFRCFLVVGSLNVVLGWIFSRISALQLRYMDVRASRVVIVFPQSLNLTPTSGPEVFEGQRAWHLPV